MIFENEIENLADAEELDEPAMQDRVTQTLWLKLGAAADVEMVKQGSIEAGKGFSEITGLLNDPGQKAAVITTLSQAGNTFEDLEVNLRALFTCKEAHAALHDFFSRSRSS